MRLIYAKLLRRGYRSKIGAELFEIPDRRGAIRVFVLLFLTNHDDYGESVRLTIAALCEELLQLIRH